MGTRPCTNYPEPQVTRQPTYKTLHTLLENAGTLLGKPLFPTPVQCSTLIHAIFTMEENGITFDDVTLSEVLTPNNPLAAVYTAPGFDLFDTTLSNILIQEPPRV